LAYDTDPAVVVVVASRVVVVVAGRVVVVVAFCVVVVARFAVVTVLDGALDVEGRAVVAAVEAVELLVAAGSTLPPDFAVVSPPHAPRPATATSAATTRRI
jgi:hypothetical protein